MLFKEEKKKIFKIFIIFLMIATVFFGTGINRAFALTWEEIITAMGFANPSTVAQSTVKTITNAITGGSSASPESGLCPLFQPVSSIKEAIFTSNNVGVFACFYQFLYVILVIASWAVSLFMLVFDSVFTLTVVNMKTFIDAIDVIEVGWTAIRDMANILFIFMLLYLAIATILQLDEHGVKHGLSRLIVGAMLINFSLFFVKIPIDVSNILAIEIYNKINTSTGGIGTAMISSVNFQSVFTPPDLVTESTTAKILSSLVPGASLLTNSSVVDQEKSAIAFAASGSPITTFAMAIIMMTITIFVFAAVIIIFVKRLLTLIMLMIFSPLAFAGMAIPNHNIEHEITSKFWGQLLKESFYAPAFMMMIYLGLTILNSTGFKNGLFNVDDGASFIGGVVNVGTIINFSVIIIILIFALTVSETMGVKGAAGAIKMFDTMRTHTTNWVGRNTGSRLASTFINAKGTGEGRFGKIMGEWGDNMRDWSAGKKGNNVVTRTLATTFGRAVTSTMDKAAKPFDEHAEKSREWMEAAISNKHGDHELTAQLFAQASAKGLFSDVSTDRKAADNQFHHMSLEQKANMKKYLEDMSVLGAKDSNGNVYSVQQNANAKAALDRYYEHGGHGRLEQDEVAQLPRAELGELTYYDNKFRGHIKKYRTASSPADKLSALNEVKEFIKNSKSEAQMSSAIRSLGSEAKTFEGNAGKDLREALSDEVRKKFSGGAFYENIGKDNILSEELRSAVAAGAYEQKLTHNLYEAVKSNTPEAISDGLASKFAEKLKKLDDPIKDAHIIAEMANYEAAIVKGIAPDYAALLAAYEQDRVGTDEITKNLTQQTNGKRVLLKTVKVGKDIQEIENMVSRKIKVQDPNDPTKTIDKDVYKVKLGN